MNALQAPAMTAIDVHRFQDDSKTRWNDYVLQHSEGTLFHLTAWKRVIERAFGFQAIYLFAEENGRICGVLPMFLVSNWIQGRSLISTPFAVYGGICASTAEASLALQNAARKIAEDERVDYLELRESHRPLGDRFLTKNLYVTFEQLLTRDPEKLMNGFPKTIRYMIRKGQKNGLHTTTSNDHLDIFYEVYAHSVRNLGTPVFSKRLFQILLDEFGHAAKVSIIWHESKAVAGTMSFWFRDEVTPYYAASLKEGRQLAANNFMFWDLMRAACEQGLRKFDFGRTKLGTGGYFFKNQWNMTERSLPYQFYLVKRKSLPNFSPVNPRFKVATEVWKRIPFPLTKVLGPSLVRLFP